MALALLVATTLASTAGGAAADDRLKKKRRALQGAVRAAAGDLEQSSTAVRAARARLQSSRAALVVSQRRLASAQQDLLAAQRLDAVMQARLRSAEQALASAQSDLARARAAVVEQRRAIGELAASNYATGDPALMGLAAVLNTQDTEALTMQLNTVSSLMNKQTMQLDRLKASRAQLVTQEARVSAATDVVAVQRTAAAANLERKAGLQSAAVAARTQYAELVVRNRAAQTTAQRARQADLRELRTLRKQEARIRQLIIERAQRQRGGYSGETGGFLYRPVPGAVTSPFGYRVHPIYGYWGLHDGVDLRAGCGSELRAAGTGTVISRSWSNVYGNRLYLDLGKVNGKNLTAIYNHATSYSVGTGDRVRRGSLIGSAGATGWVTGCHLHFTTLLDGNPVDPMKYM